MSAMATKIVPFRSLLAFAERVAAMRRAQDEWLAHKNRPDDLRNKARAEERAVDRLCEDFLAEQYATQSMFSVARLSPPVALIEAIKTCCQILAKAKGGVDPAKAIDYVIHELQAKSKEFQEWK